MFILFERAMQLGAPNSMKRHFNPGPAGSESTPRSKQLITSAEEQVLTNLKHQVAKLQKENESLRHQILKEGKLQDESTADFSLDLP